MRRGGPPDGRGPAGLRALLVRLGPSGDLPRNRARKAGLPGPRRGPVQLLESEPLVYAGREAEGYPACRSEVRLLLRQNKAAGCRQSLEERPLLKPSQLRQAVGGSFSR